MTRNQQSTIEPDESWVAHLRELSTGIEPPTSANPHAMSRVAIRRTRNRRAVLATGGGVLTVAAVAGAAFAIGGPTAPGVLLPGGSTSPVASEATEDEKLATAEELQQPVSAYVPDGWEVHQLEGLTYALPPEIVTSGPVQDEPGEQSDMWHDSRDPDAPPFLRIAYVTPDYEFYDTKAGGLTQTPGPDATSFDLPGASAASVEDGSSEALRQIMAMPEDASVEPVRILVHRADSPGRYVITMTLPTGSEEDAQTLDKKFVEEFRASLSLG